MVLMCSGHWLQKRFLFLSKSTAVYTAFFKENDRNSQGSLERDMKFVEDREGKS